MTADAIKTFTTNALDKLAALLDEGKSERLIALLKTMARFHKYSWHNVFLIASQRPDATRVAGFQTWRSLGRFVRRGEKGIAILAPIVRRRRSDDLVTLEIERTGPIGYHAVHVFDISQTDGEPLADLAFPTGDPGVMIERLRGAICEHGVALEYVVDLDGALGTSAGGRIQIRTGLGAAGEFVVLVHEFAHELLHRAADRPGSRDIRELEAEAVAYVVGEAVGLDAADAARDYIQLYRGNREALAASLQRIQATAAIILSMVTEGESLD